MPIDSESYLLAAITHFRALDVRVKVVIIVREHLKSLLRLCPIGACLSVLQISALVNLLLVDRWSMMVVRVLTNLDVLL